MFTHNYGVGLYGRCFVLLMFTQRALGRLWSSTCAVDVGLDVVCDAEFTQKVLGQQWTLICAADVHTEGAWSSMVVDLCC